MRLAAPDPAASVLGAPVFASAIWADGQYVAEGIANRLKIS
jgi:hypothetical protein